MSSKSTRRTFFLWMRGLPKGQRLAVLAFMCTYLAQHVDDYTLSKGAEKAEKYMLERMTRNDREPRP